MAAATLALFAALGLPTGSQYWWAYPKSDCGYDDVAPQPACGQAAGGDVTKLKACCTAMSTLCGGFNTNGIIKKTDCLQHIAAQPACDLYVLESKPQPPPPPPSVDWPPVWPLPAKFTNGTQQLSLDSGFEITISGEHSPILAAAASRYTGLIFSHAKPAAQPAAAGPLLSSLGVSAASHDESHPQLETDESYELSLGEAGATLSAVHCLSPAWETDLAAPSKRGAVR